MQSRSGYSLVVILVIRIGIVLKHKILLEIKLRKKRKAKKLLPAYFCSFGVELALDRFIKNKKNAEKRIKNKKTKDLTPKEQKCIFFYLKQLRV